MNPKSDILRRREVKRLVDTVLGDFLSRREIGLEHQGEVTTEFGSTPIYDGVKNVKINGRYAHSVFRPLISIAKEGTFLPPGTRISRDQNAVYVIFPDALPEHEDDFYNVDSRWMLTGEWDPKS